MLKQRVITALVMVAVLLPALFAPAAWPFALLSLVLIAAAGWEWARLNPAGGRAPAAATAPSVDAGGPPAAWPPLAVGGLLAASCGVALVSGWALEVPRGLWWFAAACWVAGGALALARGVPGWPRLPRALRLALGVVLLFVAWLALVSAKAAGANFLLSALCLVWAADIAAYFGGRAFGKRKLAPSISPGKSWAGVVSGMLGALVLAAFWLWLDTHFSLDSSSLYMRLLGRFGVVGLALSVVLLTALSVVGDLFESLVKRAAGAKDSSQLLPGHGGVLDRIDALLPVLPIAMALVSL